MGLILTERLFGRPDSTGDAARAGAPVQSQDLTSSATFAAGNVTAITNAKGELVERYTYSITGTATITDGTGQPRIESAVGNRSMYRGREWIASVGAYNYRNRVYSPELGRFLQTDPVRFAAGAVNIYRYCFNRYTRGSDPYGLGWWDDIVDAAGGVITDVVDTVAAGIDTTVVYVGNAAEFTGDVIAEMWNMGLGVFDDGMTTTINDVTSVQGVCQEVVGAGLAVVILGETIPGMAIGAGLVFLGDAAVNISPRFCLTDGMRNRSMRLWYRIVKRLFGYLEFL